MSFLNKAKRKKIVLFLVRPGYSYAVDIFLKL